MRSLILISAFLMLGLAGTNAQNAYYKVKFPDDRIIYSCYAYPDTVWPVIEKYSDCSFNVGVAVKDQVFSLNQTDGCKKILRTWTLIHWCTYDPNELWPVYIQNPPDTDVGATVFGVPSNRGHITYTQIIKVVDKFPPAFLNCPASPVVFCDYTNNDATQYNDMHVDKCEGPANLSAKLWDACSGTDINVSYRLFLDLDGNGSMETLVSSSSPNAWPIDKSALNNTDTVLASIHFPNGHGFPYGTHKIEWIANDNCGNESICKYEFVVKDCKAPTTVCLNGLSVNIMSTGMITLWDTDFIQYSSDNCTPASQIKFGIRKAGTGTGFPEDSHSVTFDCTELGSQPVEVWAKDGYGNADYCSTYVIVQDHVGACPPSPKFSNKVAMDNQKPVPGVGVLLKKGAQTFVSTQTNADGVFDISSLPAGCNYTLTLTPPTGDSPKDGINSLDVLLLSGQLDDIVPLANPYKLLAADVDKSGTLTTADLMSIVKVVLGAQQSFPAQANWQFVPASYTFPNPQKPWSASVPSSLTFCLSGDMPTPNANFIAIKTGDVDGSNDPANLSAAAEDRSKDDRFIFSAADQIFKAGDEVRADIISPDLSNVAAFQFTLDYDPAYLSSVKVDPDLVSTDFYATPQEGFLTTSWHSSIMLDPTVQGKNVRSRVFTLIFTALQDGKLSEVLHMSSAITPAAVYTRQLSTRGATLRFKATPAGQKNAVALFPVQPNPVQNRFTAAFYLPEAGNTTLVLTDARGQVLQSVQAYRESGYQEAVLELSGPVQPGRKPTTKAIFPYSSGVSIFATSAFACIYVGAGFQLWGISSCSWLTL